MPSEMSDSVHDAPQVIVEQPRRAKAVTVQPNRQNPVAEGRWIWLHLLYPPARPRDLILQGCSRAFPVALGVSVLVGSAPWWWGRVDLLPVLAALAMALGLFGAVCSFVCDSVPDGQTLLLYQGCWVLVGVLLAVI